MERDLAEEERQLCNRLTAVKLALQILERKTSLSDRQRGLVERAIEGVDALSAALLRRVDAERSRPGTWAPLDRLLDAGDSRWLSRQPGRQEAAAKPRQG
jgi:hypothetical protein